jgi:hypothetical protein
MRTPRLIAGATLGVALTLTACGGGANPGPDSDSPSSSAPVRQDPAAPFDFASLRDADNDKGVVLIQQNELDCEVMLYSSNGELMKIGTFTKVEQPASKYNQSCDGGYAPDFTRRVVETKTADGKKHVAVLSINGDGTGTDITPAGTELQDPRFLGAGLYVEEGSGFSGYFSTINLDGTGLKRVKLTGSNPQFIGNKLVSTDKPTVANADGSVAVQYLSNTISGNGPAYRVGPLSSLVSVAGEARSGKKPAYLRTAQVTEPVGWYGDNQFLTATGATLVLNTVNSDGAEPTITSRELGAVPGVDTQVGKVGDVVVCGDAVYTTVSAGGTQGMSQFQTRVVAFGLKPAAEAKTVASVKSFRGEQGTEFSGSEFPAKVVGCIK